MLLVARSLQAIPRDLFDAARIDGAGPFRTFGSIVLPLARPILGVISLLTVIGAYKDFLWPLLVENLVNLFFFLVPGLRDDQDVLRFLPFDAGSRMVSVLEPASSTFGDPLSPFGGFVVFCSVAAVLMAASLVRFVKRDA